MSRSGFQYIELQQVSEPRLPSVSCFCATFGRPHLLEEAIESFLRQDYTGTKELVVLNDFPGQTLVFEHPEVHIINVRDRIVPLGRKFNECVRLCHGDVLFVWDDDDIYLPWRISYSIGNMQDGIFHTNSGYMEERPGVLAKTSNYFHCNLAVNGSRFWEVGGYPEEDRSRNDVDLFTKLNLRSREIPQNDIFYVYRWGSTGSYHVSQWGGDTNGISQRVQEYVDEQIQTGAVSTGTIRLQPRWSRDWLDLARRANIDDSMEFIRSLHSEFSENAVPIRRKEYQINKIPCCYLLTNTNTQHTLKLNETSLILWELCNGEFTVGDILDMLTEHYSVESLTIRRDVFRVLDEFKEENVIEFQKSISTTSSVES